MYVYRLRSVHPNKIRIEKPFTILNSELNVPLRTESVRSNLCDCPRLRLSTEKCNGSRFSAHIE